MQIDRQWMNRWFDVFNHTYFDSELPRPKFSVGHSQTRLGSMSCKCRRRMLKTEYYDFAIRMSNYYEQDEKQFQTVLLHEMIHLRIAAMGLRDNSPHGQLFQSLALSINRRGGWRISITTSKSKLKPHCSTPQRNVMLALENTSGATFLTVVNPAYVTLLERQLRTISSISHHQWLITTDSRFGTFPKVRTLRARAVSRNDYNDAISRGEPFTPRP